MSSTAESSENPIIVFYDCAQSLFYLQSKNGFLKGKKKIRSTDVIIPPSRTQNIDAGKIDVFSIDHCESVLNFRSFRSRKRNTSGTCRCENDA